jgi:hypothetical protein
MMISILYRLTHLSLESDPLQETIRTALLVCSSTIFIQRNFMEQPYDHLLNLYNNALLKVHESMDKDLPVPIVLWLTMLSQVVSHEELSATDWRNFWLEKTILRAGINSWLQAREILRSLVWVDFIHGRLGKQAFDAAVTRQK